jgi:DNA-binding transcriptional ArsR family regulator
MTLALVRENPAAEDTEEALDRVFFALSDPVRRAILTRLDQGPALVSELAAPFDMSLQAVSRHIQVLVRAGLIAQERTGRIARCNLDAAPLYGAAVWINRYTRYWQQQFDDLSSIIKGLSSPKRHRPKPKRKSPGTKSRGRGK